MCSGVEKNNDVAKHTFYSSNKHDPCGDVIRMERRQEELKNCRREKRQYAEEQHGVLDHWNPGAAEATK
jgi:hypothetical protein